MTSDGCRVTATPVSTAGQVPSDGRGTAAQPGLSQRQRAFPQHFTVYKDLVPKP